MWVEAVWEVQAGASTRVLVVVVVCRMQEGEKPSAPGPMLIHSLPPYLVFHTIRYVDLNFHILPTLPDVHSSTCSHIANRSGTLEGQGGTPGGTTSLDRLAYMGPVAVALDWSRCWLAF